jgi:transposase
MDRKIVEWLVHGTGLNQITRTLHVGKNRVRRLRELAKERRYLEESGRPGPVPLPPYPEALFPDPVDGRSLQTSEWDPRLPERQDWIRERLVAGWHCVSVFEELGMAGLTRSSFYRYLGRHKLNRLGERFRVVPEIIHQPGEALILDWGKLRDVRDPVTGTQRTLWVFAGVLGYARYLLVRLVWRIDVETTLQAIESMLRELGGVTARLTTDTPKCIALEASQYAAVLNPAAERFAAHYGVLLEALPPRSPEKQGKIERPIPYVRRLYEAHGDAWHGIEASQQSLDRQMVLANGRRHGTRLRRPQDLCAEVESKVLKPRPALAYEIEQYHEGLVRQDGHVRFAHKDYSLDEQSVGETVVGPGNAQQVAIYHQGQRLELPPRITDPNQSKSTKPAHLKPWERAMQDGSMYRHRAAKLGPSVETMVVRLLEQGQGFVDTRKLGGILSLDKRYRPERIDAACRRALEMGNLGYRAVKIWLEAEAAAACERAQAARPAQPAPVLRKTAHQHVRPLSVYQAQLTLLMQ